ncbi:DoxX family protein [Rapidithrix thailandica]|uniref:DoxX family protein n=1 Tax=Rapidithrix thailandica TaxID=413964 RepID=A0AAW9S8Z3_9BACT
MKNVLRKLVPDTTALLLRLLLGGIFVYHGSNKLVTFQEQLPYFPDLIGIGAKTSFVLVIFAELVCGALVALGLFTRLSVIPIVFTMAIAFFIAHANDPFAQKELAFIFLLLSIVVFASGSGKYSIDQFIFKKS